MNVKKLLFRYSLIHVFLFGMFAHALSGNLMPLGDSITKGYITGDVPADEWGYRGSLWTQLRDGGSTVSFVGDYISGENYTAIDATFEASHSGINGETTAELLARTNATLTSNDPDVILLHIGTNDINETLDINTAVTNVSDTLDEIYTYNSSIKVYLARILNLKTGADAAKIANVTAYNNALEAMANTRIASGQNLQIVNMETGAGIDYTADMAGDWHPTQHGYDLMADHWYAALNGEVHHWALDETSGTTFLDAMGSADAVCAGTCPTAAAGQVDGAQTFDGSSTGLDVAETATFDFTGTDSFTIELWVKASQNGTVEVMVGRNGGTSSTYWWLGTWSDNHIRFYLQDSNGQGLASYLDSQAVVADGTWHHIAVVRDGSTSKNILYIDGNEADSKTPTYTAGFASSAAVNIGYLNQGAGFHFTGDLDDIYVHNRALSATEILAHYNEVVSTDTIEITTTPVTFAEVGVPYFYDANSSQDPLSSFDWTNGITPASWLSINADGEVSGTPASGDVANLDVNITVTNDAVTATDTQNYVLKVRDRTFLSEDMGHYWKLDETSGPTYIDSYSAVDATCTGSECPVSTTGQVANAQQFNGTNKVNITDISTFNVPAAASFTIELWVKTNNSSSLQVMIGRDDVSSTTNKLHWWVGMESTGEALFTLLDSNGVGAGYQTIKGTTAINNGEWHYITAVRDGSTGDTILYVDGVEEDSANFTSTAGFTSTAPVTIGYFILNGTPGSYFNGALDEIAIYSAALTPAEVTQHYQNGLAGNELEVLGDTVAPVITITGDANVDVEVDTPYTDEGATATDNLDGDLTADITVNGDTIDTSILGTHSVDYSVSDRAGNVAEANRTVNVVDTQAPVITLNGTNPTTVEVGGTYTELATCSDNYDASCSVVTGGDTVDTSTVGSYVVTYDATDASGNAAAQVTRTVNVVDTTEPVITLNGTNPTTVEVGGTYTELATCSDNYDASCSVVTGGDTVDTSTVGSYVVTYDATDSSGNNATQLSRTVNVVDTTAPTLSEVTAVATPGNDTTPSYTFSSSEAGTITYGGSCSSTTTAAVAGNNTITFNTLADGTYSDCTITVTDAASNASTPLAVNTFVIDTTVPDTTAPTLSEVTAVPTPGNDTTPSYTFSSSEAGTITYGGSCSSTTTAAVAGNNTITFNTLADGTYSDCTITVSDAANNASTPLPVNTFVIDTTVPDTTAPTLSEVTAVPTPGNDTTPSYTFSSSEAGTITYGGSCSSTTTAAVAGNNTITFNTLADGTYSDCTITVTDAASNASTPLAVNTFVIDTTVPDTTAPVITLNGDTVVTVTVGSTYTDAGASATDNVDGDLTGSIVTVNPVDTNTVGTYTVTYDVNDSSGNAATQVTRTVNVTAEADTTAPIITLNGDAVVSVTEGSTYTDAGASATDNVDGDLTGSIVTVNPVDTNTVGTYTVTYDVTDSSGNAATQVTRTVNVVAASSDWYTSSDNGTETTYTIANGATQIIIDNALGEFTIDDDTNTFTLECLYITIQESGDILTGYNEGCDATPGATSEQAFAAGSTVHIIDDNGQAVLVVDTPLDADLTFGE